MAKKDLNLTLDEDFAPGAGSRPKQAHKNRVMRAEPRPAVVRQQRLWPAVLLILVVNITFMATAVYWYSGGDLSTLAERPGSARAPLERLAVQLASLEVRMGELAGALQPAVHGNREEIAAVAASLQQLQAQVSGLQADMAAPSAPIASKAKVPEWLLNLGSFDDAGQARALMEKCQALGYSPEIIEQSAAGEALYVVALAGFEDRDAAELSAQAIMEQTDLNGLWAWKRE